MSVLNVKQFQKIFQKTIKQEQFKDFQVLLYKFKDIQGLEFSFSNSRTFKDFQVLYKPCERFPNSFVPHAAARVYNNGNFIEIIYVYI